MNEKIESLELELEKIKERNSKVEAEKAWEISKTRKALVAIITYVLLELYMTYLGINRPWLNALVPTFGFVLSTLTLSWAKALWLKKK